MNDLLPAVKEFLASQPLKMFIGGKWVEAKSGKVFETLDPGEGKVLAQVAAGDAADVDAAVRAAQQAFQTSGWATMEVKDRAVILHRLADLIDQHAEILSQIESLDVGKPRGQAAAFDVPHSAQSFRYYADLAVQRQRHEPISVSGFEARTVRAPYGVCGFIFPWNFP